MQVKERLALIGDQGRACERAAQALQGLQTRHEESAAAGAQALAQVRLCSGARIMRTICPFAQMHSHQCTGGMEGRYGGHLTADVCLQAKAAAAEDQSGSQEHLEDLRARMEARERWLAGERDALGAKVREATAPAAATRDRHAEAAEALRHEVEALRWVWMS